MDAQKICVAGLGIMGRAIATRLAASGGPLAVFNRTAERSRELAEKTGAEVFTTAAQVARAGIIFVVLSDDSACREFLLGELAPHLTREHLVVNMTTVSPEMSVELEKKLPSRYLEAPLFGSRGPAENGQLVLVTGGSAEDHEFLQPLFSFICKKSVHAGAVSRAAKMKLVNNMVMSLCLNALCEGLHLAEKSGLDKRSVLDIFAGGAIASPMFALKGEAILKGDYSPHFPLVHAEKDLRYALRLAEEAGANLPLAEASGRIYAEALKKVKEGDFPDFAAVNGVYQ